MLEQKIIISVKAQALHCYEDDALVQTYSVSTGKKGVGEQLNSECTPRGKHCVHDIIGLEHEENSVFVAREWTGEIYTEALAREYPERDWILTRIVRLDGLEPGRNKGGDVDTLKRFIYIHGTPDSTPLGVPGSHGCIRMRNREMITLADWVKVGTPVLIEG
ncbi:MAG: L,D-transpeptidase [Gammaproteobacteria bacterium]|nr:L,D-transpeptidase [Gammaproteobacteria bacterium]